MQEDPRLTDELEKTKKELEAAKKELAAAVTQKGDSGVHPTETESRLMAENSEMKTQLEVLRKQVSDLEKSGVRPLTTDQLTLNLVAAAAPYRNAIKGLYEVEEASIRDLEIPDFTGHPYRCVLHLKLVESATKEKKQMDIVAKGDTQGNWILPPMEELQTQVKPRSTTPAPALAQDSPPVGSSSPPQSKPRTNPRFQDSATDGIVPGVLPDGRSPNAGGIGYGPGPNLSGQPNSSTVAPRSAPNIPLPGELKGEIRINW